MPEELNFSELRKYLQGQMDMGEVDLLFDEPWTLTRKKSAAPAGRPANPMPQMPRRPESSSTPQSRSTGKRGPGEQLPSSTVMPTMRPFSLPEWATVLLVEREEDLHS